MVFSSLLKSGSDQLPRRRRTSLSGSSTERAAIPASDASSSYESSPYIADASSLVPIEAEDPDLRDFNNSLVALAAIFPDVQIEVFREMLSSFDEESRLAVVTEALLKQKMKWVRGRYRVAGEKASQPLGTVPTEERFRGAGYKLAVKATAYSEFKSLSHSTIKGVLAEHNHSYTRSRPTLIALNAKSWRFSLSSIFRKKTVNEDPENHPLVVWHSTGFGSIIPTLKSTGSAELDKELFDSFILPLQKRSLAEREAKDHTLALELNNQEAEECNSLHDCECCFTSTTFEELSACDEGHFVCYQCIRHAVKEAVFGQGWSRNIDINTGSLRCLAPVSDSCDGCISQELIRRALLEDRSGPEILQKLDERLAEDNLLKAQLPLIRCPFCSYAEVDELYLPQHGWQFRLHFSFFTFFMCILGVGMIPFLFIVFVVLSLSFLGSGRTVLDIARDQILESITRIRRRRHGLKFTCQKCLQPSCISCSKAWTDIHICHESSLLALRTQVELAMSLAIKRTCPRCNTSFVKSSGCNKLTCVCGYQMCYVCRKDIGNGEGYRHFCEHFRPDGGRGCTECSKCDLYRHEDDEVVVKKAKERAEKQWMEKEGTSLERDERVRKGLLETYRPDERWRKVEWERLLDGVIEWLVE